MDLSTFSRHFNETLKRLESRLSALEQTISRLDKDETGAVRVLRGPEGDVTKAVDAAQRVMAEERTVHEAWLRDVISKLHQAQDEMHAVVSSEAESFRIVSRAWLEQIVAQSVKQLLVDAQILSPDGSQHPSLRGPKGDTGLPSFVPGPQGVRGPTGATGAPGDTRKAVEAMQDAVKKYHSGLVERLAALEKLVDSYRPSWSGGK